ncbi:hypothetical protein HDU91_002753 [Kappamyces sp. JEL0680]|nr:hypothetical protein HDU91_002753 [Kappamyces sp. JEL0680]
MSYPDLNRQALPVISTAECGFRKHLKSSQAAPKVGGEKPSRPPSSHELFMLQQELQKLLDGTKSKISEINGNARQLQAWLEANPELATQIESPQSAFSTPATTPLPTTASALDKQKKIKLRIKDENGDGPIVKLEGWCRGRSNL